LREIALLCFHYITAGAARKGKILLKTCIFLLIWPIKSRVRDRRFGAKKFLFFSRVSLVKSGKIC
jgi:hypothetical protein